MGAAPKTIWLTGLTGSGKTTIAYALERRLFDSHKNAFVIDGENARLGFSRDLGFSAHDRRENIRRAAEFARMLNSAGLIAVCSFLSPTREDRDLARQIIGMDRFFEVYLSAPIDVCRTRDTKGVYEKADTGQIKQFSGVTATYEPPQAPNLILPTHELGVEECIKKLIAHVGQ
jgi:adenylyl-sulfate kinase